jgi:hypothetical protein
MFQKNLPSNLQGRRISRAHLCWHWLYCCRLPQLTRVAMVSNRVYVLDQTVAYSETHAFCPLQYALSEKKKGSDIQRNAKCVACRAKVGLYRFVTIPQTALMMMVQRTSSASDDRTCVMIVCTVVISVAIFPSVLQLLGAGSVNITSSLVIFRSLWTWGCCYSGVRSHWRKQFGC